MKNLYGYKVQYFDEFENKMVTERGVLMEDFFANAMNALVTMYGEQELEDVNIYFIEDAVTVVTEKALRNLMEQWEDEDETLENHE